MCEKGNSQDRGNPLCLSACHAETWVTSTLPPVTSFAISLTFGTTRVWRAETTPKGTLSLMAKRRPKLMSRCASRPAGAMRINLSTESAK